MLRPARPPVVLLNDLMAALLNLLECRCELSVEFGWPVTVAARRLPDIYFRPDGEGAGDEAVCKH